MYKDGEKQFSVTDIAQYIFWTGDESGVARSIDELINDGYISREAAIIFLKEIRQEVENLETIFVKYDLPRPQETVSAERLSASRLLNVLNDVEAPVAAPSKQIEYDESTGRIRLADFLYTEYSLEEVIYQLAKVMFSQSLNQGSEEAQIALQKLTTFLETEGAYGRISPSLQKKVLDVLLAALSDTLNENPELMSAAKKALGAYLNKISRKLQYKN